MRRVAKAETKQCVRACVKKVVMGVLRAVVPRLRRLRPLLTPGTPGQPARTRIRVNGGGGLVESGGGGEREGAKHPLFLSPLLVLILVGVVCVVSVWGEWGGKGGHAKSRQCCVCGVCQKVLETNDNVLKSRAALLPSPKQKGHP